MAGKKQLPPVRLATDSDKPVPPKSLSDAFETDDRLLELQAKRRILIAHIESPNTLARDLAALMRRDDELAKQIDDLIEQRNKTEDELAQAASTEDAVFNPHAV